MVDELDSTESLGSGGRLKPGVRVGRYKIIERLGMGGMGEVYLAADGRLDRRVALKFVAPHRVADTSARARLLREAKAAAKLNAPNIVTVYDTGEHQQQLYIAMEYVEGEALTAFTGRGPVSFDWIVRIVEQVVQGLAAAHAKQIVHRDIKPSNIIVTAEGQAKVLDFGLARSPQDDDLTRTGSTLGTLAYMSPEQARGEVVDHRSDLFSVGILLYELTTGSRPFVGEYSAQVLQRIIEEEPVPPERHRPNLPLELRRLLSKCLEKDPRLRYQHADECLADLRRLKRELAGDRTGLTVSMLEDGAPESGPVSTERKLDERIPEFPPLPALRWLILTWCLGLASVALLTFWIPRFLEPLESLRIGPSNAERIAKSFVLEKLDRSEASLFRFRYHTKLQRDWGNERKRRLLDLSRDAWSRLADWQPVNSYKTWISRGDGSDSFRIHTSSSGKVFSVRYFRPLGFEAETPSEEERDAEAARLALELFAVDESWEAKEPSVESYSNASVYEWTRPISLPPGWTVEASISLVDAGLLSAQTNARGTEPVWVAARQDAQRLEFQETVGWILLVTTVVLGLVAAVKMRWLRFPSLGLTAIVYGGFVLHSIVLSDYLRSLYVLRGVGEVVSVAVRMGLVNGVIWTLSFALPLSLAFWPLRALRPELLAGLRGLLRPRVTAATWIRSAGVGLFLGPFAALLSALTTVVLLRASGRGGYLGYSPGWEEIAAPWSYLATVLRTTAEIAGFTFGALVLVVVVGEHYRLKYWAWVIALAIALALQPNYMASLGLGRLDFLVPLPGLIIWGWACARFGVLTGFITGASLFAFAFALDALCAGHASTQHHGLAFMAVWLGLAGYCIYRLLTDRATEPELRPSQI